MSDVKCPYCKHSQEINHDDGYGYEEDETYTQECERCEKEFNFTTIISFDYFVYCKDGKHEMEKDPLFPEIGVVDCERCDYYTVIREPQR